MPSFRFPPKLGGFNLAAPGPIGGTTPSAGAFTTISSSGTATFLRIQSNGGLGYNNPLFFQPVAGDANWAYGSFNSGSEYYMQVSYADNAIPSRGFRIWDTAGGSATAVFSKFTSFLTSLAMSFSGTVTVTGGVIYGTFTVGTFPTTTYLEAVVTDALAPVAGASVAAGGSAKCKVMYNGSAKIVTAVL